MGPERIHELLETWARQAPEAPFLIEPYCTTTMAQLQARVEQGADELRRLGVRAGDRVLIVAENCAGHVALILACSRVGAWSCGVNARMTAAEVDAFAARADIRVAYFTVGVSEAAVAHAQRWNASRSVLDGLSHSASRAQAISEPRPQASDVAALIFTSGTSGLPKAVMATHRALLHFARVSAQSRSLAPQDRVYAFLPMTHSFGLITMLLASLHAGAALVLRSRFDPEDLLLALANEGIATLQGPPTMFSRLLAHLESHSPSVERKPVAPRLRYLYTGSAPLDLSLKRRVERVFGLPLHHGYGLSEYAGSLFLTDQARPRDDTAAGYLVEGGEIRIVDGKGDDVAVGETGEMWIRGVGLMPGYFRDSQATALAMRPGGWYATGDLGRREADGALFVVGRLKEMIIRSGFNVYPAEIETVINVFPGVQQSAVVGVPEDDGNESIVAFVEMKPGARFDEAALARHLSVQLSPYKRPARYVALAQLPTTSNGKVLKREMTALLNADCATKQI